MRGFRHCDEPVVPYRIATLCSREHDRRHNEQLDCVPDAWEADEEQDTSVPDDLRP